MFRGFPEGGFGLLIMDAACDRVQYLRSDGLNIIRLTKSIEMSNTNQAYELDSGFETDPGAELYSGAGPNPGSQVNSRVEARGVRRPGILNCPTAGVCP